MPKHPGARKAYNLKTPPFLVYHAPHFNNVHTYRVKTAIATQTARGGQNVEVNAPAASLHDQAVVHFQHARDEHRGRGERPERRSSATPTALVSQQNGNYPQPIGDGPSLRDVGRPRRHHRRRLNPIPS